MTVDSTSSPSRWIVSAGSTVGVATTAISFYGASSRPERLLFAARCLWCDHRWFGWYGEGSYYREPTPFVGPCPIDGMPPTAIFGQRYQKAIRALIPEEELVLLALDGRAT